MQSVSLYRTRIVVDAIIGASASRPARSEGGLTTARPGSILQVLAVADLLDDSPHALVVVDRVQQVFGRDGRRVGVLGGTAYLDLERAPDDHGEVGAAHAAHDRQALVVVDLLEERPPGVLLGPAADQLQDLLLGAGIG